MIYRGIKLTDENLRHARTFLKRHLSPVIVQSLFSSECFTRKGTRSVRASERIVFLEKETRQLVRIFEENQE